MQFTILVTELLWVTFLAPRTSYTRGRVDRPEPEILAVLPLVALVELGTDVTTGVIHDPVLAHFGRRGLWGGRGFGGRDGLIRRCGSTTVARG